MHMLVVEDDPGVASFLDKGLRAEGHAVTVAPTMEAAKGWLTASGPEFDMVLLDLRLPDGTGETLLRWARARGLDVPVIALTAKAEVRDKIAGLDAGANDYVQPRLELQLRSRVERRRRLHRIRASEDQHARHAAAHPDCARSGIQAPAPVTDTGGNPLRRRRLELRRGKWRADRRYWAPTGVSGYSRSIFQQVGPLYGRPIFPVTRKPKRS